MDTGNGYFETADSEEELRRKVELLWQARDEARQGRDEARRVEVWRVGEIVELKGSRFRVASIGDKFLRLRLLPRSGEEEGEDADGGERCCATCNNWCSATEVLGVCTFADDTPWVSSGDCCDNWDSKGGE